jgi:PEGA domain
VIYRIMAEQPPAPSLLVTSVPAGVNYVVQKALAKEPDERYGSCAELVADLKNHPALEEQGKAAAQQVNAPPPFPDLLTKTAKIDLGATQAQAAPAPTIPAPLASKKKWGFVVAGLAVALTIGAILWRGRGAFEPPPATTPSEAPATLPPPSSPPASPAASAPTRQAPVPAAPAAMGRLVIHTDPDGARIIVNGKPTSYRSPVNFGLAPGSYKITVERDGYSSVTKDVVVKANQSIQVRVALKSSEGGGILHRLPLVH